MKKSFLAVEELKKKLERPVVFNDPVKEYILEKVSNDVRTWIDENIAAIIEGVKDNVNSLVSSEIDTLRENELHNIKKGDQGEQGATGPEGPKGDSIVGPQGPIGPQGVRGERGPKGDSIVGPQGPNGKDGSPDKPLEIADKLNTLKEKVEPKVIIGLIDWMKKAEKRLEKSGQNPRVFGGGGSGGSATIYSQTPVGDIDGVNKVYTVSNSVTTVINFSINGMQIHPAEYSVVGSTITFVTALPVELSGAGFTVVYT